MRGGNNVLTEVCYFSMKAYILPGCFYTTWQICTNQTKSGPLSAPRIPTLTPIKFLFTRRKFVSCEAFQFLKQRLSPLLSLIEKVAFS